MLPLGVPGLIALGGITLAGPVVGLVVTPWDLPIAHKCVQIYSVCIGLAALYFWGWALLNCLRVDDAGHQHLDLGVVSFVFPLAVSLALLIWPPEESRRILVLNRLRIAIAVALLLPTANYAIAIYLTLPTGENFRLAYFCVGTAWWILADVAGVLLMTWVVMLRRARGESDALSTREVTPDVPEIATEAHAPV